MRKMLFTVLCTLLFGVGCEESESQKIRALHIPDVDLSALEDGRYRGEFTHHNNLYETEVLVEEHRIKDIRVLHSEGDEYDQKAMAVIQKVIEQQSVQVDAVTGATKSSKLYLLTIYSALSGEEIDLDALKKMDQGQ